ncbi:hypothetical protein [Deinococcus enclensis]|uniref:Uncharacterized protein n=1 Tax=Deinococcus enclensis TaxID=1049582 RepID=A0ABT9MF22_9DEIO|nr:hypothetical protein [Deinococcus enclensis]MDP9765167.1 hypothetical protein [Deinococcus enclensis]
MIPKRLPLAGLLLGFALAAPNAYTGKVNGWTHGAQSIGLVTGKDDVLISGQITATGTFTLHLTDQAAVMRPYLKTTDQLLLVGASCSADRCGVKISDPGARWNFVKALYVQNNPGLGEVSLISGDDMDAQLDVMDPDPWRPHQGRYFAYAERPVTVMGSVIMNGTPSTVASEKRYTLNLPTGWSMIEKFEEYVFNPDQTMKLHLMGMRSVPMTTQTWSVKQ